MKGIKDAMTPSKKAPYARRIERKELRCKTCGDIFVHYVKAACNKKEHCEYCQKKKQLAHQKAWRDKVKAEKSVNVAEVVRGGKNA